MKNRLLWEISIASVLAYIIIYLFFSGNTRFEELAMGTETVSYQATDSSQFLLHLQHWDSLETTSLLEGWNKRGRKPVTFFLGNSQTHSINQKKDSEVNFIEQLFVNNQRKGIDVLCVSQPNAGMEQFYLSYMYLKSRVPLKTVVIPVFMDDMREEGIRADVFFQRQIKEQFQLEDTSDIAIRINAELRSQWPSALVKASDTTIRQAALPELPTLQEKTESRLNGYLDHHSTVWANRQNVRGDFFNWIYKLRNTVLGIKASTVRKMIPLRYAANLHALQLIVEDCKRNHTKVLLYIPPIRSDVTLPYNDDEYAYFKSEVNAIAALYPADVLYANYESIVPGELWGYKEATNLIDEREIDFMHFQYRGHQILADSLQVQLDILNQIR